MSLTETLRNAQIMIDIETLGTSTNCVVLSVAAVAFDLGRDDIHGALLIDIDPVDCERYGMKVEVSTFLWWLQQSQEARDELTAVRPRETLFKAMRQLAHFCRRYLEHSAIPGVWAKGPHFDLAILENCFRAVSMEVPWTYNNYRDTRTLAHVTALQHGHYLVGTLHKPLDDCNSQIRLVQAAMRQIQRRV